MKAVGMRRRPQGSRPGETIAAPRLPRRAGRSLSRGPLIALTSVASVVPAVFELGSRCGSKADYSAEIIRLGSGDQGRDDAMEQR